MCVLLKGEEEIKARAGKRLIANMKDPSFVASLVGADQPPCFCCSHKADSTCPHTVGDLDCKDYVLYSGSPEKVERKLFDQIEAVHRERVRSRESRNLNRVSF